MNFVKYWLAAHQHSPLSEGDVFLQHELPSADSFASRVPTRPKRLLEILQDQRIRLVSDMPVVYEAPYVALSYCWNSTHNCILEVDTVPLYTNGVSR